MAETPELHFLRLFPLEGVVLFPGMELPLMVFEDRYHLLVQECQEEKAPFGAVLLRSGREVGDPTSQPHDVGTTASIEKTEPAGPGRLRVLAMGRRRFKVHSFSYDRPYVSAQVEYLPDQEPAQPPAELVQRVHDAASEYFKMLISLRGGWLREVSLPDRPEHLSYLVAQMLHGEKAIQQRLLEAPTSTERLEQEAGLLQEATSRAQQMVAEAWSKRGLSRN